MIRRCIECAFYQADFFRLVTFGPYILIQLVEGGTAHGHTPLATVLLLFLCTLFTKANQPIWSYSYVHIITRSCLEGFRINGFARHGSIHGSIAVSAVIIPHRINLQVMRSWRKIGNCNHFTAVVCSCIVRIITAAINNYLVITVIVGTCKCEGYVLCCQVKRQK